MGACGDGAIHLLIGKGLLEKSIALPDLKLLSSVPGNYLIGYRLST